MRSSFYTVEGLDGCGKSTITKYAGEYLKAKGVPVVTVESYPRDTDSMILRDLWIQQKVSPEEVLGIILELRKRVLLRHIVPALLDGCVVISDRWHDTTWAYQHHAVGIPSDVMRKAYKEKFNLSELLEGYDPDTKTWLTYQLRKYNTIYLNVDLATSRARVAGRGVKLDAFELEGDAFFHKLHAGYLEHFRTRSMSDCGPLTFIDAKGDIDQVKTHVNTILNFAPVPIPPKMREVELS